MNGDVGLTNHGDSPSIWFETIESRFGFGSCDFVDSVLPVTLFLIRHAVAGVRNNQDPSDDRRPLDMIGIDQAKAIAEQWDDTTVEAIYSSPATRCVQTVEPLAEALGLPVQIAPELFEGASFSRSIEYVRSFTGRTIVMCSHGDVIPDVLRNLEVGGTRLDGRGCAKGSVWRLDNSTERIESGTYRANFELTG